MQLNLSVTMSICEKKSIIKPFVASEEAACNLINCLKGCRSVAKLHCG